MIQGDHRIPLRTILIESAHLWAQRSTCSRLKVGCVLTTPSGRIVQTGYNGAPAGFPHCDHSANPSEPCAISIHAEANTLIWAGRNGVQTTNLHLYTSHTPCLACAKLILVSGISHVFWDLDYRDREGLNYLNDHNLTVTRI